MAHSLAFLRVASLASAGIFFSTQAHATEPQATSAAAGSGSEPPAAAEPEEDAGPGKGMYLELNAAALFATSSSHEWRDACPSLSLSSSGGSAQCDTSSPMGLMGDLRLGMRFGYVGVELMGLFGADWSAAELNEPIPGVSGDISKMQVGRVGGGIGGGLRLMTAPGLARVSLGAGGGAMFRHVYSSISSLDGTSTGYQAPFVIADVTVTLLQFLNVGVVGMVEFNPDVTVNPNFSTVDPTAGAAIDSQIGSVSVFQKPSIFIGPRVGLHFGG